MTIQGTHAIALPPEKIFAALNDPSILQQAISGCEKLEKTAEDEYTAHLKIGVASVKGSYAGKVRLTDKQPPRKFTLLMEGKGAPGFVQGTTVIELREDPQGTRIDYIANVQVGGLIAAVGSRVIEAVAKKLSAEFFQKFCEVVQGRK